MSALATDIDIRPIRRGDDVLGLILPIQQQEFALAITAADQPDLADIDGFYRRGAGEFWVAAQGERIIGCIALIDIGASGALIDIGATGALIDIGERGGVVRKMFVAVDHRGRSAGVAQRLLDVLTAHAVKAGLTALWLGTTEKFLAAHRFYEKNGFSVIAVLCSNRHHWPIELT